VDNLSVGNLRSEFWRAKSLSIKAQADLPGKAASGRRGQRPFDPQLLTGCDQRDLFLLTSQGKVMRQVWMFKEIQDKVRPDVWG
jgi:hypothetical protein